MLRCSHFFLFIFLTIVHFAAAGQSNHLNSIHYPSNLFDSSEKIIISSITISGNKKTKEFVILQEMSFKSGDILAWKELDKQLNFSQQQIYNTQLFSSVNVTVYKKEENRIGVLIDVKERWYVYPIPKFKLTDRNLNDWAQNQHGALNRVVYGMTLHHYNLTGRKDPLKIVALNGFSQALSVQYKKQFSNSAKRSGLTIGADYNRAKEFIYKTDSSNKALFYNDSTFSRKNCSITIGYSWRKKLLQKHSINFSYNYLSLKDSALFPLKYPHYLNSSKSSIRYIDVSYTFQFANINNVSYPLKGHTGYIQVFKRGIDLSGEVNMFNVSANYNTYRPLSKNWFLSLQLDGKITLPFKQCYINQKALGYGENYMRGLELYVVDGVAMGLSRLTFKKKIYSFNMTLLKKSKYLSQIPFSFYGTAFTDMAYVYNKENQITQLNNKLLYTAGIGLDVVSIYDCNMRIGYGFNQLNTKGFFIHLYSGF